MKALNPDDQVSWGLKDKFTTSDRDRELNKWKLQVALSALLVAIGAIGIRAQSLPLIVSSFSGLLVLIMRQSKSSVLGFAVVSLLLYPTPGLGYLYGRDTHGVARIAEHIVRNGWPVKGLEFMWGFPETPFIHFQGVVVHLFTGLQLYPGIKPRLLVFNILPILCVAVAMIFTFLVARHLFPDTTILVVMPVLLWPHLFRFYTGARREVLGLLFLTVLLYLSVRYIQRPMKRWMIIVGLASIILPITHHFSGFIGILLLTSLWLGQLSANDLGKDQFSLIVSIGLITLLMWWLNFGILRGVVFAGILSITESGFSIGSFFASTEAPSTISRGPISRLLSQIFYVYVGLIAIAFTTGIATATRRKRSLPAANSLYLFSISVGVLTIFARWFQFVDPKRTATFFIVLVGPVAVALLASNLTPNMRRRGLIVGTLLLATLAASGISPHIVSQQPPSYESGELSQRYEGEMYASAYFMKDYSNQPIIGDGNMLDVGIATAQAERKLGLPLLIEGRLPANGLAVLSPIHGMLYKTPYRNGWAEVQLDVDRIASRNQKLYDNGKYKLVTEK